MLKLKLKETIEERGVVHPFTWLKNVLGIYPSSASSLLKGTKESISFKDLDTLCQALGCTPNDLFYYVQDGRQTPIPPEHPLLTLKASSTITDWQKIFKKLTPQKVAELARQINKDLTDKE